MITVHISLFGALRQYAPTAAIELQCPTQTRVSELRAAIVEHAKQNWPADALRLLAVSAIASEQAVLHDEQAIPDNHRLALLPPVSGG